MKNRMRRLRLNSNIREVFAETALRKEDLIYPIFVKDGVNEVEEIKSLKGQKQYTVDRLDEVIKELNDLDIRSAILFGVPDHKDACGSGAERGTLRGHRLRENRPPSSASQGNLRGHLRRGKDA